MKFDSGKKWEEGSLVNRKSEEVFREYVDDLMLQPEDFDKKILDVGSGAGDFAKYARDHNISTEIYNLEPKNRLKIKEKTVRGRAQEIPFKDNIFDLVLSRASFPYTIWGSRETDASGAAQIDRSLEDMLRVLKPGGEIRFGPIREGVKYEEGKREIDQGYARFKWYLEQSLKMLKTAHGAGVQIVPNGLTGSADERENQFMIKIKKPKDDSNQGSHR